MQDLSILEIIINRGKKLDLFIGAEIDDGWKEVHSPRKTKISDEIISPAKHFLYFSKEKRRGKTVTLVGVFQLQKVDAIALLKSLKKKLGCGGKYTDATMEFQGELKDKLRELLIKEEFRFRQGH